MAIARENNHMEIKELPEEIDNYYAHREIYDRKEQAASILDAILTVMSAACLAELVEAGPDRVVVLSKKSHQPMFVKDDAINTFDQWNDVTGALQKGSSWYYEAQAVIEEVAAMAFGAGIFYESERAALAALKGEGQ